VGDNGDVSQIFHWDSTLFGKKFLEPFNYTLLESKLQRGIALFPELVYNGSNHRGLEVISMKVLLINCSPHEHGTTSAALEEVAATLTREGIETEQLFPGTQPIRPCTGCGGCARLGKCVYDDAVNVAVEKMKTCDGMVVGTPVHYAGMSGIASALLGRMFYSGSRYLRFKPAAGVAVCRRAGATSAFDELNKFFTYAHMPVVPSQYWNIVFGSTAEEARRDLEGLQTMRTLGRNMAWLLKCIEAGRARGVVPPTPEKLVRTNFIR